mmetsp:Transcript_13899/g.33561  ORF Transcript_13899/g.33561 Transcript_13899/m.33561 type:complete len:258 (-) Transcript_13899:2907-3680(-)
MQTASAGTQVAIVSAVSAGATAATPTSTATSSSSSIDMASARMSSASSPLSSSTPVPPTASAPDAVVAGACWVLAASLPVDDPSTPAIILAAAAAAATPAATSAAAAAAPAASASAAASAAAACAGCVKSQSIASSMDDPRTAMSAARAWASEKPISPMDAIIDGEGTNGGGAARSAAAARSASGIRRPPGPAPPPGPATGAALDVPSPRCCSAAISVMATCSGQSASAGDSHASSTAGSIASCRSPAKRCASSAVG